MDDLLAEFLTEANESLADLDEALLTLERAPEDRPTVGLIFRLVHTIKGTCGFLGLARLERVAHSAENVLGLVREGALTVTPPLISAVLQAADVMKAIVTALGASGDEPPGDDSVIIASMDAIFNGETPTCAPESASTSVVTKLTRRQARARTPTAVPKLKRPLSAPVSLIAPASATPNDAFSVLTSAPDPGESSSVAKIMGDASAEPIAADGGIAAQTIRVSVGVLENLMTLVSELVLTRNQLLQISRTSKEPIFATPVQRLSQITSDLQEGVMKTRMQPIGSAWSKLPRLVRDLGQELGKPMELRMLGAETEIDRQILDLVRDPLTHMVRNSADHGLEMPAERRAAGKPETGTITLNAFHEGGHITVDISDDGRGLPLDRIRDKVIAKGLATEAEVAAMPPGILQRFIFHPGFSTASQVTSVSGRGVGMDVVKTNIERIGGTIELESQEGKGTTVSIKIPLTLAIVSALIVEAAKERFAIAQSSVAELVHAEYLQPGSEAKRGQAIIEQIDGTSILRLREKLLVSAHLPPFDSL